MLPSKNRQILEQGMRILLIDCAYTQREIRDKLEMLGLNISYSSLSNLNTNSRPTSLRMKKRTAQHLLQLIERETCQTFDDKKETFVMIPGCTKKPVPLPSPMDLPITDYSRPSYLIHDGRRFLKDKVNLYQKANYEIIEIGLRLKNLIYYFESNRESAFLLPLQRVLEKGVNFKCYLLNPEGGIARRYLEDRSLIQSSEIEVLESMGAVKNDLQKKFLELNKAGYPGKMELYYYDHFPSFHASVIDGDTETGYLHISSYLYGVSRANCPVIELSRRHNQKLYKRYWTSVKAIIDSPRTKVLVK